ncbi:MAG: CinA family protein [Treponema sp.]|jgi:PncC family amidohydrolase|nr:CinA family protein [Treponema sp.]
MQECDLFSNAEKAADAILKKITAAGLKLALAESCTAGLGSALLAGIPGASSALWGSYVCYTKEAKISMLGIEREKIITYDLVSSETASLMVNGALLKSGADIAAAVTGLAGPDSDGGKSPVGTVWVAAARKDGVSKIREFHFKGSRNEIRIQAVIAVFECINALT